MVSEKLRIVAYLFHELHSCIGAAEIYQHLDMSSICKNPVMDVIKNGIWKGISIRMVNKDHEDLHLSKKQ